MLSNYVRSFNTDDGIKCWVKCSDIKLFNPNDEMIGRLVDWMELHETYASIAENGAHGVWFNPNPMP